MKITTKTVEKKVYIASDGQEFDSEHAALCHEEELEMEANEAAAETLRVYRDGKYSWPSMFDPDDRDCECRWFRLASEDDAKVFSRGYGSWFRSLRDVNELKQWITDEGGYPQYICVVEKQEPDFFFVGRLVRQFYDFMSAFSESLPEEDKTPRKDRPREAAEAHLKQVAAERGAKWFEIVGDSYEYRNGLVLIAYADENHTSEEWHLCVSIDDFAYLESKKDRTGKAYYLVSYNDEVGTSAILARKEAFDLAYSKLLRYLAKRLVELGLYEEEEAMHKVLSASFSNMDGGGCAFEEFQLSKGAARIWFEDSFESIEIIEFDEGGSEC